MRSKKKGFTLVELLVVIAILAILVTVSIIGYKTFIDRANRSNAENEARQIEQLIKSALILDDEVYIEKSIGYYIVFTKNGSEFNVRLAIVEPESKKITDIPKNLVEGLEYVGVGGLKYTSNKGIIIMIKDPIVDPLHQHTEVIDPEREATCSETGLTEGKHCSACNEVLIPQKLIPLLDHKYDNDADMICNVCGYNRDNSCSHSEKKVISGRDATCTAEGITTGIKCETCGAVLIPQREIPKTAHTYDDDMDTTCNVCGYTRDISCSHTEEIVKGYDSTCTSTGLTDGKKCSKCEESLVSQTVIPMKNHIESDWIIDKEATIDEEGIKHTECTVCSTKISEEVIPKIVIASSQGLLFELNTDKTAYTVIGIGECEDTIIVIPSEHNGLPVTAIGNNAFKKNQQIQKVYLADSVVEIGEEAFRDCVNLTYVDLGNGVTSIGSAAFYYSGLKSIVIPANVKKIEIYAFMTSALKEATFEVTEGWYTYWYEEWRDVDAELDYPFRDVKKAAEVIANMNCPFYHD